MSTSKLLKKNCDILKFLYKGKPSIRDYIIKNSNKELINCFHKICLNILYRKIKLTKNKVHKFIKYKKALNGLSDKKKSIKYKRRILQTGGFLSLILGTIVPLITSLIGSAINKNK